MSAGFHHGRGSDHGAADLAARLKLHRSRDEWRGSCPTCGYPEAFALSVGNGGRLLGWCASCQDKAAIARLLAELQGDAATPKQVERYDPGAAKAAKAFELATALWNGSEPVPGTIAERYLAARGLPQLAGSPALRFRPDCAHPSRYRLPALIALVQGADGGPCSVHRTYLRRDGSAKADIEPPRATLGPVRGGAIRLDPVAAEIVVGEGIETAASAGLLLGLPAWSAVSAGNMALALQLPPQVRSVVIAADPDEPGRQAANTAWGRWDTAGIRCRIATPKSHGDFNDLLRAPNGVRETAMSDAPDRPQERAPQDPPLPVDRDEDELEEAEEEDGEPSPQGHWRPVGSNETFPPGDYRYRMNVTTGQSEVWAGPDGAPLASPPPEAPAADGDAPGQENEPAGNGPDTVAAAAAELRVTAARLAATDEDTRAVLLKPEAKRLRISEAALKAAIKRAEEKLAAEADRETAIPDVEMDDEPDEARWDRLITELLPLKGPALSKAIKVLATKEKADASAIRQQLQIKRTNQTPPPPPAGPVRYPEGYSLTERGLFYQAPPGADGQEPKAEKITSTPFELIGETSDEGGGEFGLLLRWRDSNKLRHQWAMPQALVHSDGNMIASELQRYGLKCSPTRSAHERLKMFLAEVRVQQKILCVGNSGWHDAPDGIVFVLLDGTVFGGDGVVLQTERVARGSAFTLRGTLDGWNDQVGRLAVGNDRMALCICTALASPLLHIMNEPSGGIHLVGTSKIAKSAISRAGTSVWGRADAKGLERSWRNTTNGLEGAAAESTGILLTLEEFGLANPNEASDGIYMLANESGKTRAGRDGTARQRQAWAMFFLSTGEITLQQKMAEAGKRPSAGLLVRFANVPADAGCGLGVFQNLHGMSGVEAFGRHLHLVTTTQQYGTAGRAFLQILVSDYREYPDLLRQALSALRDQFLAEQQGLTDADAQVKSVASRFAVLAAAGELASRYQVLTWPGGEALRAVGACFQAWLTDRGSAGPGDEATALLQVRHFIEAHGESRFTQIVSETESTPEQLADRPTINRVGFRKMVGDQWEYWILPESWAAVVCKGLSISPSAVAAVLRDKGFLIDSTEGQPAGRVRVPGEGRIRAYRVTGSILDHEDDG